MSRLAERFDALQPWFTRATIGDETFGGDHSYDDDWRVKMFFECFPEPRTILELGSFEGGHSVELARPECVERLVGLEGRPENIERAELVAELLGRGNIEFRAADLDRADLEPHGRFDAVFCAGLLYHLTRPWRLLEEIAKVTDRLLLDSHYSATGADELEGHRGSFAEEGGYDDVLSGLSPRSFWLTLGGLIKVLTDNGFAVTRLVEEEDWKGAGRRVQLACERRPAASPEPSA